MIVTSTNMTVYILVNEQVHPVEFVAGQLRAIGEMPPVQCPEMNEYLADLVVVAAGEEPVQLVAARPLPSVGQYRAPRVPGGLV